MSTKQIVTDAYHKVITNADGSVEIKLIILKKIL